MCLGQQPLVIVPVHETLTFLGYCPDNGVPPTEVTRHHSSCQDV